MRIFVKDSLNASSLLFQDDDSFANDGDNDDWTERTEFKIIFGLMMGTLCVITIFGNLCAIYRYRKVCQRLLAEIRCYMFKKKRSHSIQAIFYILIYLFKNVYHKHWA